MNTTNMITRVFNNGLDRGTLTLLPVAELTSLSICFDTDEARDLFCGQFPKSMKVRAGRIGGYKNRIQTSTPYASINIMRTHSRNVENKITGSKNESGVKRMERFHKAVQVATQTI